MLWFYNYLLSLLVLMLFSLWGKFQVLNCQTLNSVLFSSVPLAVTVKRDLFFREHQMSVLFINKIVDS